jgi:CRISPR/Cas system-associated protein Cas10 (large subunit of type III CRISPR-Cas system)
MTRFGISKKDIMNMGRLLSTEFRRTNFPPYDRCLAFLEESFFSNLLPCATQKLVAGYGA